MVRGEEDVSGRAVEGLRQPRGGGGGGNRQSRVSSWGILQRLDSKRVSESGVRYDSASGKAPSRADVSMRPAARSMGINHNRAVCCQVGSLPQDLGMGRDGVMVFSGGVFST